MVRLCACLLFSRHQGSAHKNLLQEPNDRRFAGSVGAIIVGSLLRQRAIEADLAKLRFVSHVSHELRTPLHGCNSQIELIREVRLGLRLRVLAPSH